LQLTLASPCQSCIFEAARLHSGVAYIDSCSSQSRQGIALGQHVCWPAWCLLVGQCRCITVAVGLLSVSIAAGCFFEWATHKRAKSRHSTFFCDFSRCCHTTTTYSIGTTCSCILMVLATSYFWGRAYVAPVAKLGAHQPRWAIFSGVDSVANEAVNVTL
jgi:hypothetical protein